MALKIDISKAFDTINWSFLPKNLAAFGFNRKFYNLINIILQSTYLSIGINGKQVGFFNCTNGVRHGDPLSHLIFYVAK